jgi:hypothetical protein
MEGRAEGRLAFRELGLAIGLQALSALRALPPGAFAPSARTPLRECAPHVPRATEIIRFWLLPEHHRAGSWIEHRDINDVMLATALLPDGFLVLPGYAAQTPNG